MTDPSDSFDELGTIGVEEEFYAVDSETLMPVSASDDLLPDPPSELRDHIDTELFKFTIETTTDKAYTVQGAYDEVLSKREALKEHARSFGYEILAAGLHPAAKWRELEHIQKPRYQEQLDKIQYPQHRNITAGLHVHIGVDDADKAVWVCNEIRPYLPMMLALGANSPFWYGFDTGLKSARAVIFENLPNTGMPSSFDSWEEFRWFEKRMLDEGSIGDRGEIWWDVRPNSEYGTVEVRAPDSQYDPEKVLAFIALSRALVLDLAQRYETGEDNTDVRREILVENKWRATRYGHDASFMRHDTGTISLERMVEKTLDGLEGERLGLVDKLLGNSGSEIQLQKYENGDFYDVCDALRI